MKKCALLTGGLEVSFSIYIYQIVQINEHRREKRPNFRGSNRVMLKPATMTS